MRTVKIVVVDPDELVIYDSAVRLDAEAELLPDPCPYTQAHTREWCGRPTCRES